MLKCIHKIQVPETGITKFTTDYGMNCVLHKENQAFLYGIDGSCIRQFECRNKMQESVFADKHAIVALDTRTICFYNLRNHANRIVKRDSPIHALLPGPDSESIYLGMRRIKSLDLELISTRKENTILRLEGLDSMLSALKRLYVEEAKPIELSITHAGEKTYICNKTQKVKVFSGAKSAGTLEGFPLPIYRAVETPHGVYLAGAKNNWVQAFDETKEIFAKEFPFIVKEVLSSASHIVVICEHGIIFMLNFEGDIVDGGFLGKEIIDCKVSPDGLLWCLTEDNTLMIIDQEETEGEAKINQWLHLAVGRKTPLQEALCKARDKDEEDNSRESKLQTKARKLNKKEKDLKALECRLKQESAKLTPLLDDIQEREKQAQDKLSSAKALEAEMLRLGSAEELCSKLKELKKKADEDKVVFPITEEEISKLEEEIKESEKLKSEITKRHKNKSETLAKLKNELDSLAKEENALTKDYEEAASKLSGLNSLIEERKAFIKNAPEQIKALKEEEKSCELKVKELVGKISALKGKISAVQNEKETSEKALESETEKLHNILSSAEIVRKKQNNLPEIDRLTQELIGLINKTLPEKAEA